MNQSDYNKDPNPYMHPYFVRQYDFMNAILRIREMLISEGFWDQESVNRFVALFSQTVDIDCYEVDYHSYTIQIKIAKKKKATRPINALDFLSNIGNTIRRMVTEFRSKCIACIKRGYPNLDIGQIYDLYSAIASDDMCLYNLVNVQCIGPDTIQIVL